MSLDKANLLFVNVDEFRTAWTQFVEERRTLIEQRTNIETELIDVRNKISRLTEIIDHLTPLAGFGHGMFSDEDVSKLGLTDAIRYVVNNSKDRMSPQDVRTALNQYGYDLSSLSAPMASIYKILSRLSEGDDAEFEKVKEDGKVFYKSKIADEDIPF